MDKEWRCGKSALFIVCDEGGVDLDGLVRWGKDRSLNHVGDNHWGHNR